MRSTERGIIFAVWNAHSVNTFLGCAFPPLWCLPILCMLFIIYTTVSFQLVHLHMFIRSTIFYLSSRSRIVWLDLHGSRPTLGQLVMSRPTIWLGQPLDCLLLWIVGFLSLISSLLSTRTTGPGAVSCGLTQPYPTPCLQRRELDSLSDYSFYVRSFLSRAALHAARSTKVLY